MWIWRPAKIIVPILKTKTLVPNQFTAWTFCVLIISTPVTEDPEIQSTWLGMSLGSVKGRVMVCVWKEAIWITCG